MFLSVREPLHRSIGNSLSWGSFDWQLYLKSHISSITDKISKSHAIGMIFAPAGFWPRGQTRGGILVSPAYTYKECVRIKNVWNITYLECVKYWCSTCMYFKIHFNYNMACITISARSNKFASKWPRFWSKSNWKRFQRSWRWIVLEQ